MLTHAADVQLPDWQRKQLNKFRKMYKTKRGRHGCTPAQAFERTTLLQKCFPKEGNVSKFLTEDLNASQVSVQTVLIT